MKKNASRNLKFSSEENMNPEKIEKLKFLQNNRSFLGREFLTWLWFALETRNHIVDVPGYEPFKLYVDDKLVLSSASGAVREHSLKGGTPASASEAKTALRSGKLVTEGKFILRLGEKQWTFSMKADDLSVRGLRLPPVTEQEAESYMRSRIVNTETLNDVITHLYKSFLKTRLSRGFRRADSELTKWAMEGI
jgi:hypothetical protein